ncbi:ScbR family autoregulator-binding transcription factor [Streptomyces enissocaesilis]|uniref:ScbR family autoregulator-binding transcription factor n=1 Tax=Streptomyces enissocaesilis TaxID=332589 RepID=A0ABN3WT26_9ACTN
MTRQERGARTRHALIRSAAKLFERHGYERTRLAEISSDAGVSPGALHFHFRNKAAVADAVVTSASHALHRAACRASRDRPNALQALTDISHTFAFLLSRDVVVRAGFQLGYDTVRPPGPNLRQEWRECVERLLAQALDEGVLAEGVALKPLTAAVVAATTGFEVLGRGEEEWLSRPSLTGFWQLLLPRVATPRALSTLSPDGADFVIDKSLLIPEEFVPETGPPPHGRRCRTAPSGA